MSEDLENDYSLLISIREEVMKVLEIARKEGMIRHPYEAKVYIKANSELEELLKRYSDYLNFFLTVSQVELSEGGELKLEGEEVEDIRVGVSKAEGKKCPRCWIYYPEEDFEGEVCRRCCRALQESGHVCT